MRLLMLRSLLLAVFIFIAPITRAAPTQSLGAFITPTDAWASSSQATAGRTPCKLIDGSGWGERVPGSGIYVHTNDVSRDGSCMWNGPNLPLFLSKPTATLFGTPGPPLARPVRETPEVPWDTPATWVAPQRFGAQASSEADASAAIQQAIDLGATTVFCRVETIRSDIPSSFGAGSGASSAARRA